MQSKMNYIWILGITCLAAISPHASNRSRIAQDEFKRPKTTQLPFISKKLILGHPGTI